jgi:chromosome segregation ATPase
LTRELDRNKQQAASDQQRYQRVEEKARATAALLEKARAGREEARIAVADLEKKLADAGLRLGDLQGQVRDADTTMKQLQAKADSLPALRDELKEYRDKLTAEQALALTLEKTVQQRLQELTDLRKELAELREARQALEQGLSARDWELAKAGQQLQALQGERTNLLDEVSRTRSATANRFAGIGLTGRRVVFLVDQSGSMGLMDLTTEAKDKWPDGPRWPKRWAGSCGACPTWRSFK